MATGVTAEPDDRSKWEQWPSLVPGILPQVIDIAGIRVALKLVEELGGTAIYFARKPRPGSLTVKAVGIEAMQALAPHFGNETIDLPGAKKFLVAGLTAQGIGFQEISRRIKLDRNTVRNMSAAMPARFFNAVREELKKAN